MSRALRAAVLAAMLLAVSASTAGAFVIPTSPRIYDVSVSGSYRVEWTEQTGDVGVSCQSWSDEKGSQVARFASVKPTPVVVSVGQALKTTVMSKLTKTRTYSVRYGPGPSAPGCGGVCPAGTAARAADGTCSPAIAGPVPQKTDCGTRTTQRSDGLVLQTRSENDVAGLGWKIDGSFAHLSVGPLLYFPFKRCRVLYEPDALPIRLIGRRQTIISRLGVGKKTTFTDGKSGISCTSTAQQFLSARRATVFDLTPETCSLTYKVRVRVKRTL